MKTQPATGETYPKSDLFNKAWRKLHLAVDSKTHEIICADLSLNNVTDSEAFPGLIRQ
ncbi:transposase, partial [Enterobacter cloacae]|uniref:transposase n=1 Tax=Enterobacter cloacae TaxID=550 RepID=UPI003CD035C5